MPKGIEPETYGEQPYSAEGPAGLSAPRILHHRLSPSRSWQLTNDHTQFGREAMPLSTNRRGTWLYLRRGHADIAWEVIVTASLP